MIYENVKAACDKKGVTIKNVETACKLGNGAISKWKDSFPNSKNLIRVAEYLNVPITDLIHGANVYDNQ